MLLHARPEMAIEKGIATVLRFSLGVQLQGESA
jgi:hypothetical protein